MVIREYRKEDLYSVAKIHVDTWNSTYLNIVPKTYLESRTYEAQKKKWIDRLFNNEDTKEFMFVAENENGDVVGFSTGSLNDLGSEFDSTLYTIYILKDYQNNGLGKSLMKVVASKLILLGAKNMVLSAFAENKACDFYEHLGGKKGNQNIVNIEGIDLIEINYEWEDINCLVEI